MFSPSPLSHNIFSLSVKRKHYHPPGRGQGLIFSWPGDNPISCVSIIRKTIIGVHTNLKYQFSCVFNKKMWKMFLIKTRQEKQRQKIRKKWTNFVSKQHSNSYSKNGGFRRYFFFDLSHFLAKKSFAEYTPLFRFWVPKIWHREEKWPNKAPDYVWRIQISRVVLRKLHQIIQKISKFCRQSERFFTLIKNEELLSKKNSRLKVVQFFYFLREE